MLLFLRLLFGCILVSMVLVTSWASLQCPLFSIPPELLSHPWFVATLFDAYWGFLCFFLWIAWKEKGLLPRLLWFFSVMLLGNLAMASYALRELFRIRDSSELPRLLSARNERSLLFPGLLSGLSLIIYLKAFVS